MGFLDIFKRKTKAYHHILDVTDVDFGLQVLQRSFKQPLLVDFWAAWCGPCRQLTPVLERIVLEPESKVWLAKLNTEHNPQTAQAFGIQSIPNVKMVRRGTVVGEFTGLQMEHNIRRFIDEKLAQDAPPLQMKMPNDPAKRLDKAKNYLRRGDGFRAVQLLETIDSGTNLLPLAQLLWDVGDGDALTGESELDEMLIDALDLAESQKFSEAKTVLLNAMQLQPELERVRAGLELL